MTSTGHIDPRGPRFGAAITSVLSLIAFVLSLEEARLAYITVVVLGILFAWSIISPGTHPYSLVFKKFVRPNLKPPKELEDPRPPRFAQQVGLSFALLGIAGGLFSPVLVSVAAAFIFLASFLNAYFGLCLGCQMYLVIRRLGIIR